MIRLRLCILVSFLMQLTGGIECLIIGDISFEHSVKMGIPRWYNRKEPVCQAGDLRARFDPWDGKIPWRRKWQPAPILLPGQFHGQRSLGLQSVRHKWVPPRGKMVHTYQTSYSVILWDYAYMLSVITLMPIL